LWLDTLELLLELLHWNTAAQELELELCLLCSTATATAPQLHCIHWIHCSAYTAALHTGYTAHTYGTYWNFPKLYIEYLDHKNVFF
jgi:hypothetical protein